MGPEMVSEAEAAFKESERKRLVFGQDVVPGKKGR